MSGLLKGRENEEGGVRVQSTNYPRKQTYQDAVEFTWSDLTDI